MLNFYNNFKIFKINLINKNNLNLFLFLFLFLTISRLIPHEPNFTPILSVSILNSTSKFDASLVINVLMIASFVVFCIICMYKINRYNFSVGVL